MSKEYMIGAYSAYAIAVKHGYEGTEAEWARLQIESAQNAQAAAASAEAAAQSAVEASAAAENAAQEAAASVAEAVAADATKAEEAATLAQSVKDSIPVDYATLSAGIVDASIINDGAISPAKTSFFDSVYVEPVNWLDPAEVVAGKYVNPLGDLSDSASYWVSGYIPVEYGDVLRYQATMGTARIDLELYTSYGAIYHFASYDADKNYITGSYGNNARTITVTAENAKYVRFSMNTTTSGSSGAFKDIAVLKSPDAILVPYSPYHAPYYDYALKKEHTFSEKVVGFLPKEICIADGRTIELYHKQIIPNAEKYHFQVTGNTPHAMRRKMTMKGMHGWCNSRYADSMSVAVYDDDMQKVWSGSAKLQYAPNLANAKTICCIGDSLTNSKAWMAELVNLSGGKLTLVGTRQLSANDANGTVRTGYHEGRSGWTAARYNKPGDATPDEAAFKYANPFYNPTSGHFDWNYYVTNSLSGVSPDAVMLWLGTNGLELDPTANATAIKTLVDYIRADDADIPIFCCYTIYPGTQDALGAQTGSDGYAANKGAWQYEEYKKVLNLCIKLTELMGEYANLHFVPLASCHDSEHNYGSVVTPVNPRAAQTELMPVEAIHPQAQGYYQIADVVYSMLCAHLAD